MSGGLDQFFERNRENVLSNFVDAETLNLGSIGVQGSILATGADITTQWGVVWGRWWLKAGTGRCSSIRSITTATFRHRPVRYPAPKFQSRV